MKTKQCFKCEEIKDVTEFYKHKAMGDGYLGKCKACTKKDVREREDVLKKDPAWVEKEQTRHREKYHRLDYLEKHKPTYEMKKAAMSKYIDKYPEKRLAKNASGTITKKGLEIHHWSYNKDHWKDVIYLTPKEHAKAHRFIRYDGERKMYYRVDTHELLDTREKHEEWINWCIANKPD